MSLLTQLSSLATRTATEFKAIRTLIGGSGTATISALTTTDKTSLVAAINEVKGSIGAAGAQIDDTTASTSKVYSSTKTNAQITAAINALVNGAPGALDTLKELADQLAADESAAAALTTTVAGKMAKSANLSDVADLPTARTNLSVYSRTEIGDPETDLVAVFNAGLA